jgi:Bacterial alpha-L-rhamnosidase 6 hairpin glycosidase domain/Alpha-L-rhamnosidase N-terminal domain/Bacterial alpha-L-rhamnosidase C-terminal domain/Bacterial alpha-L-rhamnosidase concanavalin-like domain
LYYSATGWVRHCAPGQVTPQACKPAAGLVVPTLNGERANDHQLDPAPTDLERALYTSTDVTAKVRRGNNVLGLTIAADSDVIAKLVIEMADGRIQTVVTDESWASRASASLKADRFAGVIFDARQTSAGWDTRAFTPGAEWRPVQDASVRVGQIKLSSASYMPPMRVVKRWKPSQIAETSPGTYTIDFGQNITGRTHIRARAAPGDAIKIIHSEKRTAKNEADPRGTGFQGFQTDTYTFGTKPADWSPEFAYYGFRYVTISGLKSAPRPADIWAEEVTTDLARNGQLETSDALINKIHEASVQTTLNNAHGIPEDCPHREKRGWSADAYVSAPQALANFDVEGFYEKFLQDIRDAQQPNGSIPDIAPPEIAYTRGNGDSIWGAVGTELPWDLYEQTGDINVLETSYPSMKSFVDWLVTVAKNNIIESGKYRGDWVAFKSSHDPLLRTAFYYRSVQRLVDSARVLGKVDDVRKYDELAQAIRISFNDRFLDRSTGSYGAPGKQAATMTQASQAVPIAFGMVPEGSRKAVTEQLVKYINDVSKLHVESGLNATRYVLEALQIIGRPDIIHAMAKQTDAPGWAHMVNTGPGTLWESWKGGSLQHAWPGVIDAHFYRTYGGIEPTAPGFSAFDIRPYLPEGMSWARAVRSTPYGQVRSEWRRSGAAVQLDVAVPVGTTARLVLPVRANVVPVLRVDGRKAADLDAVKGVRRIPGDAGTVILEVVSGNYSLQF